MVSLRHAYGAWRRVEGLTFFFFFTLVTGPGRPLSLKLSDTRVYAPQIGSHRPQQAPAQRASFPRRAGVRADLCVCPFGS